MPTSAVDVVSLDDALDRARRHLTGADDPASIAGVQLSTRESEVLRLVADGCTDREIAEQLVIGLRTAQTHVAAILRKLGVKNRREAAARFRALHDVDVQSA